MGTVFHTAAMCLLGLFLAVQAESSVLFHRGHFNYFPENNSQHGRLTDTHDIKVSNQAKNTPSTPGIVSVNTTCALQTVDPRFLSVTLGADLIKKGWETLDLTSDKVKNLARELSPAILRIGGTDADFLIFNDTNPTRYKTPSDERRYPDFRVNFTMTGKDWDKLNLFAKAVEWDILFDLNMLLRNGTVWDSSNAIKLFKYTNKRGYRIGGWELGNEPNHIQHHSNVTIAAEQLGRDFLTLRTILDKYGFQESFLVGPDVTRPLLSSAGVQGIGSIEFLDGFLRSNGNSTSATTWHHYTMDDRTATADNFTDPELMNILKIQIGMVQSCILRHRPYLPKSWIGETAGAFGGGVSGLSNAYAGGFLWLDKLGLSAKYGVDLVMRSSFYSGSYGLLDHKLNPTPVYWLSILYKQLVGSVVLNASISTKNGLKRGSLDRNLTFVRTYAHCTNNNARRSSAYDSGSITVFVINLQKENQVMLTLGGDLKEKPVYQYLLAPYTEKDIYATMVRLNGKNLTLTEKDTVPVMEGEKLAQGEPITLPPLTFGFFVVNANVSVCQ